MPNKPPNYAPTVIDAATRFGGAKPPGPPLQPPGGGGTYDGMEARVARLEADVGHIQKDVSEIKEAIKSVGKDLSDLKINYATLNERVSHLPGRGAVYSSAAAIVGFVTLVVVFQGTVQKIFNVSPAPIVAPVTPSPKL